MNIQQLRQSLKMQWLSYYEQNSAWLVKIRVWATYDDVRRPSSGFILATMSVLEPQFEQILAFIMELNNNPDDIVAALGLNFNPEQELGLMQSESSIAVNDLENEFLKEKYYQSEPASLVEFTTQDAPKSDTKIQHSEQLSFVSRTNQPVPSFTVTTGVPHRSHKPIPAIAVATKHSSKPGSLAITTEVPGKSQTLPSLVMVSEISRNTKAVRSPLRTSPFITTEVTSKPQTLPSPALTTETRRKNEQINTQSPETIPKANIPSTNARSLASWIDESCQGTRWEKEKIGWYKSI